ncbi:LuxR C-terminal-related transcriptional regulator [Lentzea sp. DG1S-22]|uniref:LuxR C-terminal-related transcriptional regulator n=1 Tax=Lentzea sp. DG1S-22 TaxID=3108822 RepID=UPI002E769B87|nr:LuxR C-terminal-related transcriptional regulator [Lentzea sp. DG1S-22]WVH81117.1 LuxR C-terminal-related transcriptional regulator [Lentzea sp. DG1S-22]
MTADAACVTCGNPIAEGRRYCSNACRQRAYRERNSARGDSPSSSAVPTPLDTFVGRREELAALSRLAGERLVSLVGPAGAGKTRLAAQHAGRRTDRVWWTALAPASDVDQAIHHVVGAHPLPGRSVREAVIAEVERHRRPLLVLDNCEHLLASAADAVQDLLAGCPRLRVLVTSREPLRLAGEQVFAVGELELPPADADVAEAVRHDAVVLFRDRAVSVDRSFEVDASNVADVVAVCRSLDGMPLAIELAARRVPVLSPAEIAARLSTGLAVLAGGPRSVDDRHRTLRAAIGWSYDLLPPREQAASRRLAVLGAPFDLGVASAVCGVPDALDLLTGLEQKSLLVADRTGGHTTFRQLESVRLYCHERAVESDDVSLVADRVVEWVCSVVEPEISSFFPAPSLVLRLDRHVGLVELAAARTAETGDWSRHALTIVATAWTSTPRGPRGAPTELLHRALSRPLPPAYRSVLAVLAAMHHRLRGGWHVTRRFATESLAIEGAGAGRPGTTARALEVLASAEAHIGDTALARRLFDEAAALLRDSGDKLALAIVLNSYGWTLVQHGEPEPAAPLVTEALALVRLLGLPHMLHPVLHTAGAIALARGNCDEAVEVFREGLVVGSEHPADQYYDLEGLALALVGTGSDDERALSLLTAASAVRTRYDFRAEPYWQDLLDEARAVCRARIPAARLRAAESTGERMSLAQAISYGLTTQPVTEDADGAISARERHVATLVAEGLTNRQIGQRLGISPHTVARHVTHARSKLGLRSRAQLAVWAGRQVT